MVNVNSQFRTIVSQLQKFTHLKLRRRPIENETCPRAMAIMAEGPGRDALESIFREAGWSLTFADTSAEALDPVCERFAIIFYERELNRFRWREAVLLLSRLTPRPYVILLSNTSDRNLWDELIKYGGSDIVRKPIGHESVVRAVESGWSVWLSQQKLRRAAMEVRA